MRKLILVSVAIVLTLCMGVAAFATTGGFVSSPSKNPAPELISGSNQSEDCVARIIITAYSNRDQLTEKSRKEIEEAYSIILGTENLSSLNEKLAELAKGYGVDPAELAVSDLFDITRTNCDDHEDHQHFDIVLKPESLENFVCLLHYYNDEWHVVDSAEVTHNGEHLEFDADDFSPFAIVVSTGAAPVLRPDNTMAILAIIAAAVVALGGFFFFLILFKRKKKKEEEEDEEAVG